MKIAIIGTGNVGGTLGSRWAQNGHQVVFGTRSPAGEKVQKLLESAGENASAGNVDAAVTGADVVVIAVPWRVAQTTIESAGDLKGKIVVDCTNPVAPGLQLALGTTTSGGEQVAEWAKGARVVKAFNTTGWENMADPVYDGERTLMLICGDDTNAKATVTELTESLGFEVVDLGPLETARLLEPFALVWIRLAVAQGLGRNFAFRLVKR
jgi:8-hydroxy-5-deazaflavin:NADPH oxidoreductase